MKSFCRTLFAATLLALLFASSATFAQSADKASNSPDASPLHTATRMELDVVKVLLAQEAAWNRGDVESFATGYKNSPDTLFITGQVRRGYADMLDGYRKNYPTREAMGTLSFTELEVHPLGENYAAVIGKYHLDRDKKGGGPASGIFSLVFEKTPDGWKIIIDHTA